MRDFWAVLLLVVSANLDSLIIGMYYGVKNTRILLSTNLLIAFIVGAGSLLSLLFGKLAAQLVPPFAAHCGSALLIIAAGLWIIRQEMKKSPLPDADSVSKENKGSAEDNDNNDNTDGRDFFRNLEAILESPLCADQDRSGYIDHKEGVLLGLALTLNNLVICLGAGVSGAEPILVAGLNAVLNLLFLSLGIKLGCCLGFSEKTKRYAGYTAGLLLVLAGLYEWAVCS